MKKVFCVLALILLATTMGYSKEKHVKPAKQSAQSCNSEKTSSNPNMSNLSHNQDSQEKLILRNQVAPILSRVE